MLGNPAPPSWKILFLHENFLHGTIFPRNPVPPPAPREPPSRKKTSVYFPMTNTIYKEWAKFITCSPSPRDFEGLSLEDIVIRIFSTMLNKMASQNFYLVTLRNNERWRGPSCPPVFFYRLKRALKLLIFVQKSPLATFYDRWIDRITPGKKNKNK